MVKKKLKSIFMMLIMLVNIIGEGAVFAAQNKCDGNKKTVDNGIYVIESLVGEGKVLDICGAEKTDGAKLHTWDKSKDLNNSLNQVFYIDKNEDGSYAIMACHSGMFLGVKDQERNVKQFNPSFKENYKWEINLKNDDEYELKLKSNKLSLDVSGGKSQNGTKLQLWESNNTNAQRFRLHKIGIKDTSLIDELHKKMVLRREQLKLEEISLESKMDKITKYMASHFEKLKIVHISQEVEEIEEGAFEGCKSIETVLCSPKMLKGFDKSKIKTLVILGGIKNLEKKDFQGLENLEALSLPESVEKIEKGTFDNLKNIKELKCDPKWFEYFNRTKIEELEKLRAEIIKDNGIKDNENIQNQIDYFKEKIEILENRLAELGVTQDKKNANNNEKLEGIEQLKKLEKETEELLAKYINKCKENEEKLYRQIIENGVETALKNGKYKTEELVFENNKKVESQTTIEGIVKSDAQNKKYVKYAKKILENLEKDSIKENNSQKKSLDNISEKISYIFKKIKDTYGIKPYPVQVMTVLRLSDEILNGKNTIAEVKTGEGKSFVIAVLALVLSKYGHRVDIVTSTEELAKRDNENQRKYYELFGIGSGVLKRESEEIKHAKNEFNLEVLDREIVYSTNSNFQFLHLESVFKKEPERKREYDVVIVDEVDNMLLDQSSMPAIISERLTIKNRENIFRCIYENRYKKEEEIIEKVKGFFKNKKVPKEAVLELYKAARNSDEYEKDKDYVVKDNEVIIIDSSTGYKKPGSRWSNYIHEMLELKEGLELKESSVSNSMITQKSFFNMYKHITGLTGTVGNERDRNILEEAYSVQLFKMPRNKASRQKVMYIKRNNDVLGQIEKEIKEKQKEKTPVLVILPTNALVNEFVSSRFPNAKKITGVEIEEDREAIKEAGKAGNITIATNAAGRGIDIILDEKSKKGNGLHVIIPYMPENERILEQAMGRSARQGEPGSVSIYFGNGDIFYETPGFEKNYDKLLEIQNRFSEYVKSNYPWLYKCKRGNKILFESEYELGVTPKEVLKGAARDLTLRMQYMRIRENEAEQILTDTMLNILLKAWGVYFQKVSDRIYDYDDAKQIEEEYEEFIEDLEEYFPRDKKTVYEAVSHMVTNESLEMIDELAGEILKIISKAIEMMPDSVIKKALEDKIVQGLMKTAGGLAQIATGCELCTTVVGTIQGIPMIVFGTNTAVEGISELWYISKGEFDQEGKNLIKEATGHKADNIVELAELGVAIWSGGVASKRAASKAAGRIAGEAEKVSEGLQKLRGFRKAKFKTKKLVRKFLPKKRYRKMAVVDVEELAKKQGLKPNLQLFAEETKWDMPKGGKVINGRYYTQHALERMAPDTLEIRAKLSRRAEKIANQKGYKLGTKDYNKFCIKYVNPRNIPPSVVEDAIKNGIKYAGKELDTFYYATKDIKVVVNLNGDVITVIPK